MKKRFQHNLILAAGIVAAGLMAAPVQAQYCKGKTITLLIGYSPGGGVTLSGRTLINYAATLPTNGLKKPSDIAKVGKPLRVACTRTTSNFCILHRMAFALLGIPYRIVAGFRGSEQFLKAMLQTRSIPIRHRITPGIRA